MKIRDEKQYLSRMTVLILILAMSVLSIAGCSTTNTGTAGTSQQNLPGKKTEQGALYGAAGGAALGALINRNNPLHGALYGAAGGALAGGAVGYYMDRQKKDLEKSLSPEIKAGQATVQKLPDNAIQVSTTPQTAFATGSAELNTNFIPTLQKVADVVKTYGKSTVTIIGAPDTTAATPDQSSLANQRAETIRTALIGMGVKPVLITASGNPQAAGTTEVVIQPLVAQS